MISITDETASYLPPMTVRSFLFYVLYAVFSSFEFRIFMLTKWGKHIVAHFPSVRASIWNLWKYNLHKKLFENS